MEHQVPDKAETMPVAGARGQILTTVERLAMLYYHFATTLVRELGDAQGKALIRKAIAAYGAEIGERQRARVAAAGYPLSCEHYKAVPDLPALGWTRESMPTVIRDGREIPVCPLAKYWIEKGAADLGRLYCSVDQAKYSTFDPACECRHLANVLDGDDRCEVVVKKRREWADREDAPRQPCPGDSRTRP